MFLSLLTVSLFNALAQEKSNHDTQGPSSITIEEWGKLFKKSIPPENTKGSDISPSNSVNSEIEEAEPQPKTKTFTTPGSPSVKPATIAPRSLPNPNIESINGFTDSKREVVNGRWTGQPSGAPATASNQYKGFLAVDTWEINNKTYTWDINGSGFGSSPGSIWFDYGVSGPLQISISIVAGGWSNNKIQVRTAGDWAFNFYRTTPDRPFKIMLKTAAGLITSAPENVVAAPHSRGYGQCT